jgi:very-short-patch-repair endonuclease
VGKKTKHILKRLKKALKVPKTKKDKANYVEKQAKKMDRKPTKPEKLFKKILKQLGVEYQTQEIVGGKIYDFYIPSKNILVEVDGDYWHGKDTSFEDMKGFQRKAVKNDMMKDVIARGSGYQIERVWEQELEKEYEITKERFKKILL